MQPPARAFYNQHAHCAVASTLSDFSEASVIPHTPLSFLVVVDQGSQTHLGVGATLQDITQSVGRIVFRDDKMQ